MSWTKLQLITEAYAELAMQGYVFDLTPEDLQAALRRMDTMMAVWEGRGVQLGYDFPPSPDESDINGESGLPDTAVEPVYLNLAVRLGPGLGKAVSIDTRRIAAEGFDALLRYAAQPTATQMPSTMPRGAGNKPWLPTSAQFFPEPVAEALAISPDGDLDILPE